MEVGTIGQKGSMRIMREKRRVRRVEDDPARDLGSDLAIPIVT